MATEVKVPTLGESITEATLGEWLKKPGDAVAADEPIASLETDKVSVEVPSPVAGTMGDYSVQVGDTVEVGAVIASIESGSGGAKSAPTPPEAKSSDAAAKPENAGQQAPGGDVEAGGGGGPVGVRWLGRAARWHRGIQGADRGGAGERWRGESGRRQDVRVRRRDASRRCARVRSSFR